MYGRSKPYKEEKKGKSKDKTTKKSSELEFAKNIRKYSPVADLNRILIQSQQKKPPRGLKHQNSMNAEKRP